ncbi:MULTISPECIES: LysR family transcriptional regulator [Stappia]|uniref:LysR family transcriptional regulator, nitrogen assimilation regulatory protein n=1 Tax=Stappia indica TaxID=538381 RepID=A0A285TIF0_9HYPH|nr:MULTISPECIES: LysR family transcriptional regulator [Stappia]MBC2857708.1 LysR family transcriptional regulator [Stappia sp. 28M-7]MCC4246772.1 LysR family transcriptional regulator [Stappia indica]SOC20241.1 LysR family transcriptional regulator, nitrogen assimilation regulatory protein [Stappia indica]
MKIRQLEYFMHVVNTLNITHAAERANVSQPALSRQVQLLEEELGTRLVDRRPRGVALTPAGQRLADHVRALMQNVELIKEDIIAAETMPAGSLRISSAYSLRGLLIADVVAEFHRLYPQVNLEIHEGVSINVREELVTRHVDLAIYSDHGASRGLNRQALCSEGLVLLASPAAGLRMDAPVPSTSLVGLDLVLTPSPNGLRRVVEDLLPPSATLRNPPVIVETNSIIVDLVSRGGLHSILPYSACHQAYTRGEISIAPVAGVTWPWVIATSRDRPRTAAMRVFTDLLLGHARRLAADGVWITAELPPED